MLGEQTFAQLRTGLTPKHARVKKKRKKKKKKEKKKKKKAFSLDSNDSGFICAGVNFVGGYKWHLALFELFVTILLLFEHQQKTAR